MRQTIGVFVSLISIVFLLTLILISAATIAKANETGCQHDEYNFRCVSYVKNYDADTITFDIAGVHPLLGKHISIRVLGVDAPEIKTKNLCEKKKAKEAQKIVETLLKKAERIDLENVTRGKYFRIVADVVIDGESLTRYLINNSLAYAYDGGTKTNVNWCQFDQKRLPASK